MSNNRQDDLSFHMRIPTNKCFVTNVLLTLDGICDHFCFTESSRDRIKKALDSALSNSIESFYQNDNGLFDLQISFYKNKLMILVEDYLINADMSTNSNNKENSDKVKNMLKTVQDLADNLSILEKNGCNACYSMVFNVSFIEGNISS